MPSDDFNRTDSTGLGANWIRYDTLVSKRMNVVSNTARPNLGSLDSVELWDADPFAADQSAQVTLVTLGANTGGGVVLRGNQDTNYYLCYYSTFTNKARILYFNGTTFTLVAEADYTLAANDVLRGEVEGTALRLLINGDLKVSGTDGNIASGKAGIYGLFTTLQSDTVLDDWSAADILPAPIWRIVQPVSSYAAVA